MRNEEYSQTQLKRLRESRGWTRGELARRIDPAAVDSWSEWIRDIEDVEDQLFPPCTWCAIANALGVSVGTLFGNEGVN